MEDLTIRQENWEEFTPSRAFSAKPSWEPIGTCSPTMDQLIARSNLADAGLLRTIPHNAAWGSANLPSETKLAELPSIHDHYKCSRPTALPLCTLADPAVGPIASGVRVEDGESRNKPPEAMPPNLGPSGEPQNDLGNNPITPLPRPPGMPPDGPPGTPWASGDVSSNPAIQPTSSGFVWDTRLKWIEMPEWDGNPEEAIVWTMKGTI
ncbi:hypothetical protein BS47DRAFT_1398060 [Hydnum rufescens UP504]|uniref:Uncharacterized protein n=1 Tax=Hydnum rufescens UP504 TaxID=1448309 RepID=A0A9P6ALJ5_9AGAM|nr:hypothetical protein BS47DRAFT_1398060 [Hydnum rufescens UP504]